MAWPNLKGLLSKMKDNLLHLSIALMTLLPLTVTGQGYNTISSLVPNTDACYAVMAEGDTAITIGVINLSDRINVYFCKRIISTGDTLYFKNYGGVQQEEQLFLASSPAFKTSTGDYVSVGARSKVTGPTKYYGSVYKFNGQGDTLWSKTYGDTITDTISWLYLNDGVEYKGAYFFSGWQALDSVNGDAVIIKTDTDGNLIWKKVYGTPVSDNFYSIDTSANGLVSGGFTYVGGSPRAYLHKVDTAGIFQWQNVFGTTSGSCLVKAMSYGELIAYGADKPSGYPDYDGYVAKFTSSGNMLWKKSYGISFTEFDELRSVVELPNADLVFAGVSIDTIATGNLKGWILKTDSAGNELFSRAYENRIPSGHSLYDITLLDDGGFLAGGSSSPSVGGESIDSWLLRLDSTLCDSLFCAPNEIYELSSAKVSTKLYPNPSSGQLTIEYNSNIKIDNLVVTDIVGNIVLRIGVHSKEGQVLLDLSDQVAGFYFCSLVSKSKRLATVNLVIVR
ncbi:MAG: hypothetical protein ACI9J3_002883 [Parvicellaceae bacterium]|jgi:hypothetical protein